VLVDKKPDGLAGELEPSLRHCGCLGAARLLQHFAVVLRRRFGSRRPADL
jgi:hypothetical protein